MAVEKEWLKMLVKGEEQMMKIEGRYVTYSGVLLAILDEDAQED